MTDACAPNYQVDLTNCDKEPIHRLGRIQSVGVLFAFDSDWQLVACSGNAGALLQRPLDQLIGASAQTLFPEALLQRINRAAVQLERVEQSERLLSCDLLGDGRLFDLALHFSGDRLILEFEPVSQTKSAEPLPLLRQQLQSMAQTSTQRELWDTGVQSFARLTGFDRVMLYRFNQDDSGEVVAEWRRDRSDSFLGMRFPASDIPRQARALYLRNLTRMIADVNETGVEILPPEADLDLSISTLRAVSPIHLEYLRNMGVCASMSISVVVDGRLWGLFACHHYQPHAVDLETRSVAELYVESFSLELRNRLRRDDQFDLDIARRLNTDMIASLGKNDTLYDCMSSHKHRLKELIQSDTMIVVLENQRLVVGDAIAEEDIELLVNKLLRTPDDRVTAIDNLRAWLPTELTIADRFSGLLAIPVSRRPRDMIIYLRHEEPAEINWAGNPDKPVELGPNGARLTPRKSFAAWREIRRDYSAPWLPAEVGLAEQIRQVLLEVLVRSIDERSRLASEARQQQDLLIHELNHRVRNILGLISSLVSQTASKVADVEEFKQTLGGRIQALAVAQNKLTQRNWHAAPFRELLDTEFSAFQASSARWQMDGPDVLLAPKAYTTLTLVIHELLTNALKYGALAQEGGKLTLHWQLQADGQLQINWRESGISVEVWPRRRGYGSVIIERSIPYDLSGEASVDLNAGGLEAQFLIPSRYVEAPSERPAAVSREAAAERSQSANSAKIRLGRVLVVEDNMILALEMEQVLRNIGFSAVDLAASVHESLGYLERREFEFAVLDINLGAETSERVADRLIEKGLPFVFVTGYEDAAPLFREKFSNASVIRKPLNQAELIELVLSGMSLSQ